MMLEFHINPPHEIMNRNKVFNQPLSRSVPPDVFANTITKLYNYIRLTCSLDVLFDELYGWEVELAILTGHHESRNSEFSCQ